MVPFTGLGLYNGFRGNRWLRNRITIFKQFVVPSLKAQTNQNFVLWVAWRYEERFNDQVKDLERYLMFQFPNRIVFTYAGIPFWDDKYDDATARKRLLESIQGSVGPVINLIGEADDVLMTIQPSDDCYYEDMVKDTQAYLAADRSTNVYGYSRGYVMDYLTGEIAEWNPKTTPPFYTIRFPRATFENPVAHAEFTGPYKSHEYVKDFLSAVYVQHRGFIVGTHGENISTIFKHPFAGALLSDEEVWKIMPTFGLLHVKPLKIQTSLRKKFMRRLPFGWQRKLRYWIGERFYARFYEWIRS